MKNDNPITTNGLTEFPANKSIVKFGMITNPVAKNIVPIKNNKANFLDLLRAITVLGISVVKSITLLFLNTCWFCFQ